MKSKLVISGKEFQLILEDNTVENPKKKESIEAFKSRMETQIPDLKITTITDADLETATEETLKKILMKFEGNLYGKMIQARLDAIGGAQEPNVKSVKERIKKENSPENLKAAADERQAKREALIAAKLAEKEKADKEAAEAKIKKAAELEAQRKARNEAKAAEKIAKAEAAVIAKAKRAEEREAKEKANQEAKENKAAEKEVAKAKRAEEREAEKAKKAEEREARKGERAEKAAAKAKDVYMKIASEKYTKEQLDFAKSKVGSHLVVIKKDGSTRFEGTIKTLSIDKRNGTVMYRINVNGVNVHSTIDSLANRF